MNRIIRLRSLLALAITTVLGIASFAGIHAEQPRSAEPLHAGNASSIPMLETIHVRAEAPIPTLPTIVVSAKAPELAVDEPSPQVASVSEARDSVPGVAALPHARLDMPYYSFGKLMPRVIKV